MLKKAPNFVLGHSHRSTYGKKYASRLSLPPALLDDLFVHPGAGRAWVFLLLLLAASGFGGCAGSPARHAGDRLSRPARRFWLTEGPSGLVCRADQCAGVGREAERTVPGCARRGGGALGRAAVPGPRRAL